MEVVVHSTLPNIAGQVVIATDPTQTIDSLITAFCVDKGIPHKRQYILYNADQEPLDNTKLLSTCNVLNGDVLYLGVRGKDVLTSGIFHN